VGEVVAQADEGPQAVLFFPAATAPSTRAMSTYLKEKVKDDR
jgi:hypothetical protein